MSVERGPERKPEEGSGTGPAGQTLFIIYISELNARGDLVEAGFKNTHFYAQDREDALKKLSRNLDKKKISHQVDNGLIVVVSGFETAMYYSVLQAVISPDFED